MHIQNKNSNIATVVFKDSYSCIIAWEAALPSTEFSKFKTFPISWIIFTAEPRKPYKIGLSSNFPPYGKLNSPAWKWLPWKIWQSKINPPPTPVPKVIIALFGWPSRLPCQYSPKALALPSFSALTATSGALVWTSCFKSRLSMKGSAHRDRLLHYEDRLFLEYWRSLLEFD